MGRRKKVIPQQDNENEIFTQEPVLTVNNKKRTANEVADEIVNLFEEILQTDLLFEIYVDCKKSCTLLVPIEKLLKSKGMKLYIGKLPNVSL